MVASTTVSLGLEGKLLQTYERDCQKNLWEPSDLLIGTLKEMARVYTAFQTPSEKTAWWSFTQKSSAQPCGVYLCGPVGRGKTFAMDIFFIHRLDNLLASKNQSFVYTVCE